MIVKNTTPQITQMNADKILTWYLQERTLQERIWLLICGFDLDLLHQFLVGDGVVAMTVGPGGHHAKLYEIGSSLLRDAVLDLRGS